MVHVKVVAMKSLMRHGLAAVVLMSSAACLPKPKIGPGPTWGAPMPLKQPERRKETPADIKRWATRFKTPNECEQQARYTIKTNPELALRRLQACSLRKDFDVLMPLLQGQWLPLIKRSKMVGLDILARTIARRVELSADTGSVQAAGIDLRPLMQRDAMQDYRGHIVLAPVVVDTVGPVVETSQMAYELPSDQARHYRHTVRFRSFSYRTYLGRTYRIPNRIELEKHGEQRYLRTWYATDRSLRFKPSKRCPVKKGQTWVVLAKLMDVRLVKAEIGRRPVGELKTLNCYRLDVALDKGETGY